MNMLKWHIPTSLLSDIILSAFLYWLRKFHAHAALLHWVGGWMGPGGGLDAVEQGKISFPRPQPVARLYTNWSVSALGFIVAWNPVPTCLVRNFSIFRVCFSNIVLLLGSPVLPTWSVRTSVYLNGKQLIKYLAYFVNSFNCLPKLPYSLLVLTYSRSLALLEEPLKNFPAFYGTRRFNTLFTRALHRSLSWDVSISPQSHLISLISILTVCWYTF
jgi:hypothetical protein